MLIIILNSQLFKNVILKLEGSIYLLTWADQNVIKPFLYILFLL